MLNIKIKTTNFDKTPAIEDYVYKKMASLEKFLNKEGNVLCEVELGKTTGHHKSGEIFKAELNIVESKGRQFFIKADETDLYAAIDVMRDNAEEVIVSKKKKENSLFRRGAMRIKKLLKRNK